MIIKIFLVFILPSVIILLSLFLIRRAKQRFHARLRRIRQRITHPHRSFDLEIPTNLLEQEVYLPYIGDPTCSYNAQSPYIRCAVNPDGPCENCPHYEKIE